MSLTEFQRRICRIIADNRKKSGESYIAGGAALNEWLRAPRISRDIDIFHDTREALQKSFSNDYGLLKNSGFEVRIIREASSYNEALVLNEKGDRVLIQWLRDSAFRFFPLVEDPEFGLTLHPFDLATNKVLALVGRLEARDWMDLQASVEKIQDLGYLAWAACAKDPGFSPAAILEEAARSSRYSIEELERLEFSGEKPDFIELSKKWKEILCRAREILTALPEEYVGHCLLDKEGNLFKGDMVHLKKSIAAKELLWHKGSIGGVLPAILPEKE